MYTLKTFISNLGGNEYSLKIGGQFSANQCYTWKIQGKSRPEDEVVQNALYLSEGVYDPDPYQFVNDHRDEMTISEVIDVENLQMNGQKQACIFANSQLSSTLYIALRGSQSSEDWKTNLDFKMIEDDRFLGKFHCGFLQRSTFVNPEDILNMTKKYNCQRIVTCGHSLGGAVSSLLHLRLAKFFSVNNVEIEQVNLTFGAPLFGNEGLWKQVSDIWRYRQMFHFVAVEDVVPGLLSLGNTIQYLNDAINPIPNIVSNVASHAANVLLPEPLQRFLKTKESLLKKWAAWAFGFVADAVQEGIITEENRVHVKEFIESIQELQKEASNPSNLFNQYNHYQYVPIGQFLFLHRRQSRYQIDHQDENPKIIETLITRIQDYIARGAPSTVLSVKTNHEMKGYKDKIKEALGGFFTKHQQPVILAETEFEWEAKAEKRKSRREESSKIKEEEEKKKKEEEVRKQNEEEDTAQPIKNDQQQSCIRRMPWLLILSFFVAVIALFLGLMWRSNSHDEDHLIVLITTGKPTKSSRKTEILDLRNPNFVCPRLLPYFPEDLSHESGAFIGNTPVICRPKSCWKLEDEKWMKVESLNFFMVEMTDLPDVRFGHCSIQFNHTHFVITGGGESYSSTNEVLFINIADKRVAKGPSLNIPRTNHGCVRVNIGKRPVVFITGGKDSSDRSMDTTEYMDLSKSVLTWKRGDYFFKYYLKRIGIS